MKSINRRQFNKRSAAAIAGGAAAVLSNAAVARNASPRIVVVGGGFAGAAVAKYLKRADPTLSISLIEPKKIYTTCPGSNHVIAGLIPMSAITFSYDALEAKYGIELVHDRVVGIDPDRRSVLLAGGKSLGYERLVVCPGVGFRWDAVEGYGRAVSDRIPHAWNAGPQTALLRDQLSSMPDGGLVILSPPPGLYRCGPAPYERASLIAHYLKRHKPKSKLLILDPKERFSRKDSFLAAWEEFYPGIVEWVPLSGDGRIVRVDAAEMSVETEFGERHRADVINFIPGQRAADLAVASGLTDASGWCPIDPVTTKSMRVPGVHVLGDSVLGTPLPKAASAANSLARAAARSIARELKKQAAERVTYGGRCYSLTAPDHGIEIAGLYGAEKGAFVALHSLDRSSSGGASSGEIAGKAERWFHEITADTFS